ncbi:MAG: ATP-binding cassette domain-containing protein [bacterium]|jgi:molybdopterin-binding protein
MTLELRNVTKRLGGFELRDFSLTVGEGEYFVLLGPSGVGKSVLLETIAGLLPPDSGRILWKGTDVTGLPPNSRGFAVVYQDYALFPHMCVRANIEFGPRANGLRRHEIAERARHAAELAGIAPLLERMPGTLSGGEAQRVALARAVAVSPELLLLDEPLSAVDMRLRRELRRELKKIHLTTGRTFLHVTHDVDEAMELGDRIGVLLDGKLRAVDAPADAFRSPKDPTVAEFLGMRNVIAVESLDEEYCLAAGLRIHIGKRNVSFSHIWIRPEEIILSRVPFESSARNQIACRVAEWSPTGTLVAVQLRAGRLELRALITYGAFDELAIEAGNNLYATFKSSSVVCF